MSLLRRNRRTVSRRWQRDRDFHHFRPRFESLEARHLLAAQPVISEFVASNDNQIVDEDGNDSDWIEILNVGDESAELRGWYLTDDAEDLTKWRFPAESVAAGESIVVFASNKDRDIAGRELHTNFRLSVAGEYLALIQPDGVTIASDHGLRYPPQVPNVSYGIPSTSVTTELIGDGSGAQVFIPTNDGIDPDGNSIAGSWLDPSFDDSGGDWFAATTGIGFASESGGEQLLADSSNDYSRSGEQGANNWYYGYYNRSQDNGTYAADDFIAFPDSYFVGVVWDWPAGDATQTLLGQTNMHPSGTNSGDEHWAIRRYVSEGAGSLEVTWRIRKSGLAAGGGGVTGRVFHNGVLVDSEVIEGTATDWVTSTVIIDGVLIGDTIDLAVDPRGTDGLPIDTQDSAQLTATIYGITGVGGNISADGDIEAQMRDVGSSAYVRIPFEVVDPSQLNALKLNMRFNDGFIAYLNGQPVASENAVAAADANFQSTGLIERDTELTNSLSVFDLSSELSLLRAGGNVLMIHGMNVSNDDEDFILRPELLATSLTLDMENPQYFTTPTPGEINGVGSRDVGPLFVDQDFAPLTVVQSEFVAPNSNARVLVPTNASVDDNWSELDFTDTTAGWFDAKLGIGYEDSAQLPIVEIADSWGDWSVSGTQGEGNWYYGHYNETTDTDQQYAAGEFQAFPEDYYVGVVWDWPNGNPPHTLIGIQNMLPNGSEAGQIHWPVRRYVSEATGTLSIDWKLVKSGLASGGNGVTGRLFHNGVEVDAIVLAGDNTSGITHEVSVPNVNIGDTIDFAVDPRGVDGIPNGASDTTRLSATIRGQSSIRGLIESDIGDDLQGNGTSTYIRVPFAIETDVAYDTLKLDVNYDDGFIAYLNGQQVAERNVTGSGFSAMASSSRDELQALTTETIDVSQYVNLLNVGSNVLAIHAVNVDANDSDMALVPRLYGSGPTTEVRNGALPNAGDSIVVTARLAETFHSIATVELNYRVMFGDLATVSMRDDGLANDRAAGDGVYTGTIPGALTDSGDMTRWYMTALDSAGNASRYPTFQSATDSEEYFGTISSDPAIESSNLPVLHWFVQNPTRANTTSGTRGALFYDGEFYDNVQFDIHGQSTRGGAFKKKSYDVDFTRDHRFRWNDETRRMKDINLLTNYADKGNFRNQLAYEVWGLAGGPTHLAEPVRVQQNGEFFAIYDFVEDGDDRYLERVGLDPEGAFYKMYNNGSSVAGNQKITRQDEDFSDLQAVMDGARLSGQARTNFLFDNIDIPNAINFLAAQVINANIDCCHKNYYMYRDTNGTGLWTFLPWDADLSFGRLWTRSQNYFDDVIKVDTGITPGSMVVTSALYSTPQFREMYLQRLRTLLDAYVQPPGTPANELFFERRLDEVLAALDPTNDNPSTGTDDADLDFQKWGTWGNNYTMRQEIDSVKTVFLPQRREFLYNQTVENGGQIPGDRSFVFTELTAEDAPVKAWVPTTSAGGNSWIQIDFDDSNWLSGDGGVGYERGNGYQSFIDVDLLASNPASTRIDRDGNGTNENNSVYVRYPFEFTGVAPENLTLQMRIDDGFVAYLNGTEVARTNFLGTPRWNSAAAGNGTEASSSFANFDISDHTELLMQGQNVLAIHGLNQGVTSSDMIIQAKLASAMEVESSVSIAFGAYDANPTGGDQDREYVELVNSGSSAVDISHWQVDGGIDFEIRPGTVIPAGGSLYLTPDLNAFRARTSGPAGGQGLFVQAGYSGHLANADETIRLRDSLGTVVASLAIEGVSSPVQDFLRVSEIMYNPAVPTAQELSVDPLLGNDDFEFIELMNTSTNVVLDLSGVVISQGFVDPFAFSGSDVTVLAPGERVVVVSNREAFELRYGQGVNVAGAYVGNLSNSGERIQVDDATGSSVVDFDYDDNRLWPQAADGAGASLVYTDLSPQSATSLYNKYYSWKASELVGGTPATFDLGDTPVVINEVLANTDAAGQVDAIELHNTSSTAIDVGGWYLSDSAANMLKYQIPSGTVIPGNGYLVLDESDFNPTPLTPGPTHFSLNGGQGDDVWLVRAGDRTELVVERIVDDAHFRATSPGQTLGVTENSNGRLTPLTRPTLGCSNSQPLVIDVRFAEINYLPSPPTAEALALYPELDSNDLEYLIITSEAYSRDTTGWRIRGGIDMELPSIALGIHIVSFDPEDPDNAARAAAFRAHYGLHESANLVGGYSGSLSNSGEQLRLERPEMSPGDPESVSYVLVDEVIYDDRAPWPVPMEGDPIVRLATMWFGNDGNTWVHKSAFRNGAWRSIVNGDFNGDAVADVRDLQLLIDAVNRGSQDYHYVLSGTLPAPDAFEIQYYLHEVLDSLEGDANVDGVVNAMDLNQVGLNWQQTSCVGWADGDFNGDGAINATDLNTVGLNWQQLGAPLAAKVRVPQAALAGGEADARGLQNVVTLSFKDALDAVDSAFSELGDEGLNRSSGFAGHLRQLAGSRLRRSSRHGGTRAVNGTNVTPLIDPGEGRLVVSALSDLNLRDSN